MNPLVNTFKDCQLKVVNQIGQGNKTILVLEDQLDYGYDFS